MFAPFPKVFAETTVHLNLVKCILVRDIKHDLDLEKKMHHSKNLFNFSFSFNANKIKNNCANSFIKCVIKVTIFS
jgi:hypothetical protein